MPRATAEYYADECCSVVAPEGEPAAARRVSGWVTLAVRSARECELIYIVVRHRRNGLCSLFGVRPDGDKLRLLPRGRYLAEVRRLQLFETGRDRLLLEYRDCPGGRVRQAILTRDRELRPLDEGL